MKKIILAVLIIFTGCLSLSFSQEQEVKAKEEVSVTLFEVPVRVFYKGEAVTDLKKEDFKLYENKRLQDINGFYINSRKIETQDVKLTTGEQKKEEPPRYFVLVFRVTSYNNDIKEALDYLFENVMRDKDQLLVFANDRTLFLDKTLIKVDRRKLIDRLLKEVSLRAHQRLMGYFTRIQRDLNVTKTEIKVEREANLGTGAVTVTSRADNLVNFLKKYLTTWIEYKKKYLIPDIDKYYNFASFLEKVKKQKWVINFYQIEMFPKMKVTGELRQQIEQIINEMLASRSEDIVHSRIMMNLLAEIDKELNVADDFPSEEISKLFYKVDATCHSIFCGVEKDALSQDLEFKRISTDIENSLRKITVNTGGTLITSDNLESALHTIGEKEDIYYMLTYEPDQPDDRGKLKVEVNDKRYKVVYDSNMRADYIKEYLVKKKKLNPTVLVENLSFKDRKLHLEISNFLFKKLRKGEGGRLNVRLKVMDGEQNILYNRNRLLETNKEIAKLTIGLDWLKNGEYNIIVEVTDLLTGKTAMEFIQPTII